MNIKKLAKRKRLCGGGPLALHCNLKKEPFGERLLDII